LRDIQPIRFEEGRSSSKCHQYAGGDSFAILHPVSSRSINGNGAQRSKWKQMSWAPQALTDSGQWVGNDLRFATEEEAESFLAELSLCLNTRVVESSDPVHYRW
jgi:hypothetical protein